MALRPSLYLRHHNQHHGCIYLTHIIYRTSVFMGISGHAKRTLRVLPHYIWGLPWCKDTPLLSDFI